MVSGGVPTCTVGYVQDHYNSIEYLLNGHHAQVVELFRHSSHRGKKIYDKGFKGVAELKIIGFEHKHDSILLNNFHDAETLRVNNYK